MKSKYFFILFGILFLTILAIGINGAMNLVGFWSTSSEDQPPIFRNLLSVEPVGFDYEKCSSNAVLPENAFWYAREKCRWECMTGYRKNESLKVCIELTDKQKLELEEIQIALDLQNDDVVQDADPSFLNEGVYLDGSSYSIDDLKNNCYLEMPSAENLSGYNIPLKLTCDGKSIDQFNLACIGRQKSAQEGELLTGDIQCLGDDLTRFFGWCEYVFREDGLTGYIDCEQ